jgi:HEAT repeat protein
VEEFIKESRNAFCIIIEKQDTKYIDLLVELCAYYGDDHIAPKALGKIGSPALPALLNILNAPQKKIKRGTYYGIKQVNKRNVLEAIGLIGDNSCREILEKEFEKAKYDRYSYVLALYRIGKKEMLEYALDELKHNKPDKINAIDALGKMKNMKVVPVLIEELKNKETAVYVNMALDNLNVIVVKKEEEYKVAYEALKSEASAWKSKALQAITIQMNRLPMLLTMYYDENKYNSIIDNLKELMPLLKSIAKDDKDNIVRESAIKVMETIEKYSNK